MIKWIKRLIVLLLLVVAIVVGIVFTSENSQQLSLVFLGYELPELRLGLWLLLTLLLGSILGLTLCTFSLLIRGQSVNAKNRHIKRLEQELQRLRSNGIKSQ
jgi:putative membrane protein